MTKAKAIQVKVINNKPSKLLIEKIDACVNGFLKLQKAVNDALEQGRKEGIPDKLVGDMIKQKAQKAGRDLSVIRRYLPSTAKGKQGGANAKKTSDLRVIEDNNVLEQEQQNEDTHVTPVRPETEGETAVEETQTETEDDSQIIWQINPEEYEPDNLEQYDKPTLIRIIEWHEEKDEKMLHRAAQWEKEKQELLSEIRRLKEGTKND